MLLKVFKGSKSRAQWEILAIFGSLQNLDFIGAKKVDFFSFKTPENFILAPKLQICMSQKVAILPTVQWIIIHNACSSLECLVKAEVGTPIIGDAVNA